MQDLIKQEQFELEVLDRLNSKRLLNNLIFIGGTMLRLCSGLNRFSVDLDFWLTKNTDKNKLFKNIKECLGKFYIITDCTNKFYTLLFEIKSKDYPRKLKIEIRKDIKKIKLEQTIAYSSHSNIQVLLNTCSLKDMMQMKIEAFLERKEIRDIFDIEFLLKKGVSLETSSQILNKILKIIESLNKKDYTIKLGSLLEEKERRYYTLNNFKIVKLAITEKLKNNL